MRDRIMQKAFEKMNTHGVRFTMADLAHELAVSKTTLYLYFESKEALISAIADAALDDLRQQDIAIIDNPALSTLEKFGALLTTYPTLFGPVNDRLIEDFQRFLPQEWAKIELYEAEAWERIENLLSKDIAAGVLPPINLTVLQRIHTTVMNGLLDYQFLLQHNLTACDAMRVFADILTFGLAGKNNPGV